MRNQIRRFGKDRLLRADYQLCQGGSLRNHPGKKFQKYGSCCRSSLQRERGEIDAGKRGSKTLARCRAGTELTICEGVLLVNRVTSNGIR